MTDKKIQAFIEVVGEAGVLTKAEDQQPYLKDWRKRHVGKCLAVVKPETIEQVQQIVITCQHYKIPFVPQGGNTGLTGGGLPDESGDEIIISLEKINKIRSLDIINGNVIVEAGCILSHLKEEVHQQGLDFPLSFGAQGQARIGGALSTNAGGTNALKYGSMRDLVLGLEIVLPDGSLWQHLRTVRKDNSGYDLKHLFIGAEGTLGIITAASLKLFPQPCTKEVALIKIANLDQAIQAYQIVRAQAGSLLSMIELIPAIGIEAVHKAFPDFACPIDFQQGYGLLIELESHSMRINLQEILQDMLSDLLQQNSIQDAVLPNTLEQTKHCYRLRDLIVEAQASLGASLKHDISVPVSGLAAFVHEATRAIQRIMPGIRPYVFGHLGDSNVHFNCSQAEGMKPEEFLTYRDQVADIIHSLAEQYGGSFSAEHGIGRFKKQDLAKFRSPVELDLMRKIKHALDPHGLCNPGVMFA